jgi:hypothetical protein
MSRYVPIPMRLGGLNEDENPAALEPGDCQIARNSWKRGSSRGTRPGLNRDSLSYTSSSGLSGAVQGIVDYRFANDASQFLVAVANGDIFSADATSIKNAGTTVTAGANHRWTFAQHKGTLYGAGGTSTDNFWSWPGSGTTSNISMLNLAGAAIYPSYVFEKWNFGFTAGFRDSVGALSTEITSGPMTVRHSAINDMTSFPVGNSFGGTSSIGGFSSYGDEYLTGFGEFTNNAGDWLLCLSNKRLYAVGQLGDAGTPFYTPQTGIVQNGCVHQNAFVSLGLDSGDAIYLSRYGIHSVRLSEQFGARVETFLSWKIRRTFAQLNQSALHRSVGAYDPKRGIVLFAVPFGSASNPDTILCLDMKNHASLTAKTAEWDIWSLSSELTSAQATLTSMATVRNASGFAIYAGNQNGDVAFFDDSSSGAHSDLGEAYTVQLRTRHDDYGAPGVTKGLGDTLVTIQPGGSQRPTLTPIFDYGRVTGEYQFIEMAASGATWGSGVYGTAVYGSENNTFTDRLYTTGAGETVAFDLMHAVANEPFYVAQLAPEIQTHGSHSGEQ